MKLTQLKAMVKHWAKNRSIATAYDICQFLASNLDLEEHE